MEEELRAAELTQDSQLRTGNLGVVFILIHITTGIDQVVFRTLHIGVVGQAVQRIFRTMETIGSAISLIGNVQPHHKMVSSAN